MSDIDLFERIASSQNLCCEIAMPDVKNLPATDEVEFPAVGVYFTNQNFLAPTLRRLDDGQATADLCFILSDSEFSEFTNLPSPPEVVSYRGIQFQIRRVSKQAFHHGIFVASGWLALFSFEEVERVFAIQLL